ncbi:MAG: alpha/beta hydrolase [Kiritimatiellae bacterium]|nr:alpha/beta hydrolase [Kiritimatiellia bacterium]
MLRTLTIIIIIWLGGNLIHLLWLQGRYRRWNRMVIRSPSGLLEHAEEFTCGNGKTALLMIHGFADLPYGWTRVAARLTNSYDLTCCAMRVPRWGATLSEAKGVTLEEIRDAIDSKIRELKGNHQQIWLVGHSLGCAIAIDAIPRNPESITGVATLAPLLRVSNHRVPLFTARFWFELGSRVLWLTRAFESPFTERLTAVDDPQFTYIVDKFIPCRVYEILFSLTKSNRNVELPENMPVFCAISARDKVIDNNAVLEWYEHLPNPKALYVDQDAAHAVLYGQNWHEITDTLGRFIAESNAQSTPRL